MTFSLAAKVLVLLLFVSSILYVHLRGKARLPVLRQFVRNFEACRNIRFKRKQMQKPLTKGMNRLNL